MLLLPVLYPDDRDSDMAGQGIQEPADIHQGASPGCFHEDLSGISVLPEDDEGALVAAVQHGVRDPCSRTDLHDSSPAYGMALPIGPENVKTGAVGIDIIADVLYHEDASPLLSLIGGPERFLWRGQLSPGNATELSSFFVPFFHLCHKGIIPERPPDIHKDMAGSIRELDMQVQPGRPKDRKGPLNRPSPETGPEGASGICAPGPLPGGQSAPEGSRYRPGCRKRACLLVLFTGGSGLLLMFCTPVPWMESSISGTA